MEGELQLERVRDLHEALLVPVLMYDCETMLWEEKERWIESQMHG